MNVTAKHGQAAVHIGGRELTSGRWSPACGTQHHNAGGREATPLRPTDKVVTCKRCLRLSELNTPAPAATPVLMIDAETSPKAKREGARRGWEKFHATMDVMNGQSHAGNGSDSLRDMLKLN